QLWISVGANDIIPSISSRIRALNLFKEKHCKPWSNSVVVRLLGKNIGYFYLCHHLRAIWKPVGAFTLVIWISLVSWSNSPTSKIITRLSRVDRG
ncbi:hypothetical protein LINPERHAP1_LOCUS6806, partial [Linum perenne]